MSTYYYFYIGYIDNKTDIVHVMGPFDDKGKLKEVFCKTSSFMSDIKNRFYKLELENIEEKYREKFSEPDCSDKSKRDSRLWYLNVSDLPSTDFVKSGYFLSNEVKEYLKDSTDFDGFYERLDAFTYTAKLKNELIFGKPEPKKDAEGYDIVEYSASDYIWFAYPDYNGEEYDSFLLKNAYHILYNDYDFEYGDRKDEDVTPVILMHIR